MPKKFLDKRKKNNLSNIDISTPINVFRKFIVSAWPIVLRHAKATRQIQDYGIQEYFNDWLQVNWEMLVECSFGPLEGVVLEPYGEGADCNDVGSRVWKPNALPKYRVICVPIDGTSFIDVLTGNKIDEEALFDAFCTIENDWVKFSPPFDHIVLQGDETRVIKAENISFILKPI